MSDQPNPEEAEKYLNLALNALMPESHQSERERNLTVDLRAALHRWHGSKPANEDLLDLLRKLASGEGGHRTGELKRRGLLQWEVTEKGKKVLSTNMIPTHIHDGEK